MSPFVAKGSEVGSFVARLGVMVKWYSFRTCTQGSVLVVNGVSGACPCKQRTARTRNRETSSYNSYRICGCETGHVRRVGKTRINGKGAEVYKKHIYKGYTT